LPDNIYEMKNYYIPVLICIAVVSLIGAACSKEEKKYVPAGQPCASLPSFYFISKTYHTIQLGDQCWMRENLDYGKMVDFTTKEKDNDTVEKYCYGTDINNCIKFGGLYTWGEIMKYDTLHEGIQGICPDGWHIPTDMEFFTLEHFIDSTITHLDMYGERGTNAGDRLRYAGTSGFEALMVGFINSDGSSYGMESGTNFWTSSRSNDFAAWARYLNKQNWTSGRYHYPRTMSFSLRCIKD